VACVVNFCGPSDFPNFFKGVERNRVADSAIRGLLGGTEEEKKDEAVAASPITYITKDDAPILVVHGTADNIVPFAQAEILHAALQKNKVDSTFLKLEGGGHGIGGQEVGRRVTAFFDKHLRGKEVDVSAEPIKVGVK
jgi:dipeptidyl aminopeptidase/acylaminoacyl peptidase